MPKAARDDDELMEDDSDDDLDLDSSSGEEDSEAEDDEDGNSDALSLVEASDNEDLISLDGDVPASDLIREYDVFGAREDEEWGGIEEGSVGGQKGQREKPRGGKRKKLKSLPTFASYAKMVEDGVKNDPGYFMKLFIPMLLSIRT